MLHIEQILLDVEQTSPDIEQTLLHIERTLLDVEQTLPDVEQALLHIERTSLDIEQTLLHIVYAILAFLREKIYRAQIGMGVAYNNFLMSAGKNLDFVVYYLVVAVPFVRFPADELLTVAFERRSSCNFLH